MSALVAHPAWQPARPAVRPGARRPDHRPRPVRRGALELVGPGFVPRAPQAEAAAAASPSRRTVAAPAPIRLTRRGRAVLAVLVFVVATVLSVGLGISLGLTAPAGAAGETVAVTVAAGDTLWAVAAGVAGPGEDVRDVVAEIAELNALPTHELSAGQQILVPVR